MIKIAATVAAVALLSPVLTKIIWFVGAFAVVRWLFSSPGVSPTLQISGKPVFPAGSELFEFARKFYGPELAKVNELIKQPQIKAMIEKWYEKPLEAEPESDEEVDPEAPDVEEEEIPYDDSQPEKEEPPIEWDEPEPEPIQTEPAEPEPAKPEPETEPAPNPAKPEPKPEPKSVASSESDPSDIKPMKAPKIKTNRAQRRAAAAKN